MEWWRSWEDGTRKDIKPSTTDENAIGRVFRIKPTREMVSGFYQQELTIGIVNRN